MGVSPPTFPASSNGLIALSVSTFLNDLMWCFCQLIIQCSHEAKFYNDNIKKEMYAPQDCFRHAKPNLCA